MRLNKQKCKFLVYTLIWYWNRYMKYSVNVLFIFIDVWILLCLFSWLRDIITLNMLMCEVIDLEIMYVEMSGRNYILYVFLVKFCFLN